MPTRPTKPKQKPTFASRQIEASHNKQSATVLFTPYRRQAGVGHLVREPQPSPSLRQAARLATQSPQNVPLHPNILSLADDDVEEELREGLDRLHFGPSPDSDSQSDAGSESLSPIPLSQSHSISPSHSHPQAPRAGPHSKHQKAAVKPQVGAKDVWTFFDELNGHRECMFCQ